MDKRRHDERGGARRLVDSRSPPAIVSIRYGACETTLGAAGNRYIHALYRFDFVICSRQCVDG